MRWDSKPAVDGNVLRVVSRILQAEDIMKAKVRTEIETALEEVIPKDCPGILIRLIELGAIVCAKREPKCEICPAAEICRARKEGIAMELPVKTKAKGRKIEKRTVLVFHDSDTLAIQKRPDKGLLAGLYELPNLEGWLSQQEVIEYSKSIGLSLIPYQKNFRLRSIF